MSEPTFDGAVLIRYHGPIGALKIATERLDTVGGWHAVAVYCYVKGYCEAVSNTGRTG